MAYSLNKMWTAMAASLIAAAGVVSAAPHYENDYADNFGQSDNYGHAGNFNHPEFGQSEYGHVDYSSHNAPYAHYEQSGYDQQGYGQQGDQQEQSCATFLNSCGKPYFSAEALYWRATQEGLDYGARTAATPGTAATTVAFTDILEPKFRWDWGFRLGLGYDFNTGWDFRVLWTHLHNKKRGNNTETTSGTVAAGTLTPFFGAGTPDTTTVSIDPRWRLRLDYFDFEFGREFSADSCVSLRPHIGVRVVDLRQKYDITTLGASTLDPTASNVASTVLKSNFEGAGLRGGLDTQWNFFYGFSLYGNAAISAIYGRYHDHTDQTAIFVTDATGTVGTLTPLQRHHYHACRFITDLALGLRFQQNFCCDSVKATFQVGYEHHLFVNQNKFTTFADAADVGGSHRGDLCLHGVTFGAKLDY